jgi:cholinesterase
MSPGIQKADKWAPVCHYSNLGASSTSPFRAANITVPQNGTAGGFLTPSEDCLFLKSDFIWSFHCGSAKLVFSVWTPNKPNPQKKLPVIFWIHGWDGLLSMLGNETLTLPSGGYQIGDAVGYIGTDQILTAKGGVVVVTIQYRLGLFGFLSGKEVKQGGALNGGLCALLPLIGKI